MGGRQLDGGVPDSSTYTYLDNGGTITLSDGQAFCREFEIWDGQFDQEGGEIQAGNDTIRVGFGAGGRGVFTLGDGLTYASWLRVGIYGGEGEFTQHGGTTHVRDGMSIGVNPGATGTYELLGGALDLRGDLYVGTDEGDGTYMQADGTAEVEVMTVGLGTGTIGRATLAGAGTLSADTVEIGDGGDGAFLQTGGTLTAGEVRVGLDPTGPQGLYTLEGGELVSDLTIVGANGPGAFTQSGGIHRPELLQVTPTGTYTLTGGTLEMTSVGIQGTLDLAGSPGVISASEGSLLDFGEATITNAQNARLVGEDNTLMIFPAGVDPNVEFGSVTTDGIVHERGTELYVPAGKGFVLSQDISDPVRSAGTISQEARDVGSLTGGLLVEGAGSVSAFSVIADNPDRDSGLQGGTLHVTRLYVGNFAAGRFVQDAGDVLMGETSRWDGLLSVGLEAGSEGTYVLNGGSIIADPEWTDNEYDFDEIIGHYGAGTFIQNGGTNIPGHLYVGTTYGEGGRYELHDGLLAPGTMHVGGGGVGDALQTGGTNAAAHLLVGIFDDYAGIGNYRLEAGEVDVEYLRLGAPERLGGPGGDGTFAQAGGSVAAAELVLAGVEPDDGGGQGEYSLHNGPLTVDAEKIGAGGTGIFTQDGGAHTVKSLLIGGGGTYRLSDGDFTVTGVLDHRGTLDLMNAPAVVQAGDGAWMDLRRGAVINGASASLVAGEHSFVYLPSGTSAEDLFGTATTGGIIHEEGTTLTIGPGEGMTGISKLPGDDSGFTFPDPIVCSGVIATQPDTAGLRVQSMRVLGGADVDISSWRITDDTSAVEGGTVTLDSGLHLIGSEASFEQTGGTINTTGRVDTPVGVEGTYFMRGGVLNADIGIGSGTFSQTGGTVSGSVRLQSFPDSTGNYEYSLIDGVLSSYRTRILGTWKPYTGLFVQTGGEHRIESGLEISYGSRYEMYDGLLAAHHIELEFSGGGCFYQEGGEVELSGGLTMDEESSYDLVSGILTSNGAGGEGAFTQSGGATHFGRLAVKDYTFTGGELTADTHVVGASEQTGQFTQTAGIQTVQGSLELGSPEEGFYDAGTGTMTVSGGTLDVGSLDISPLSSWAEQFYDYYKWRSGIGTLAITDAGVGVTVRDELRFGIYSHLQAVAGTTINMAGASLINDSETPADLADLANVSLVFAEPQPAEFATFEVAGQDLGPVATGYDQNFALASLQLGGPAGSARLRLVDARDNQTSWDGAEALYVDTLVIEDGASLDPNGLNIYFRNGGDPKELRPGDADLDGQVSLTSDGGTSDLDVLLANAGMTGAGWTDGDFDGDGDVDLVENAFSADGMSDLNYLIANAATEALPDTPAGAAAMVYDEVTGEVWLDNGGGIVLMELMTDGNLIQTAAVDDFFTQSPSAVKTDAVQYFDELGLPIGQDGIGAILPPGLDVSQLIFRYQAIGDDPTAGAITVVPEPTTMLLLTLGGLTGLHRRRARDAKRRCAMRSRAERTGEVRGRAVG